MYDHDHIHFKIASVENPKMSAALFSGNSICKRQEAIYRLFPSVWNGLKMPRFTENEWEYAKLLTYWANCKSSKYVCFLYMYCLLSFFLLENLMNDLWCCNRTNILQCKTKENNNKSNKMVEIVCNQYKSYKSSKRSTYLNMNSNCFGRIKKINKCFNNIIFFLFSLIFCEYTNIASGALLFLCLFFIFSQLFMFTMLFKSVHYLSLVYIKVSFPIGFYFYVSNTLISIPAIDCICNNRQKDVSMTNICRRNIFSIPLIMTLLISSLRLNVSLLWRFNSTLIDWQTCYE